MTKIVGQKGAIVAGESISWSPVHGWSRVINFEGPSDAINALMVELRSLGAPFRLTRNASPRATIEVDAQGLMGDEPQGVETPENTWEFFSNSVEIDLLDADVPAINALSDAEKRRIRDAVNSPDPDNPPTLSGDAETIYKLMLSGMKSFTVNVPTLRKSVVVSNRSQIRASLTNVGKIISTTTLRLQEEIPTSILFDLPDLTTSRTGFAYGWFKRHPTVQHSGLDRVTISQEWTYGLWPTIIYGDPL